MEAAILRELERFLIELGTDFTFVAREKRLTIGRNDYYLDLLFYHRGLRCLVAIELKLEKFRPAHCDWQESTSPPMISVERTKSLRRAGTMLSSEPLPLACLHADIFLAVLIIS